ncbi:hypothetical protein ACLOJK_028674 [Asimina triloba]
MQTASRIGSFFVDVPPQNLFSLHPVPYSLPQAEARSVDVSFEHPSSRRDEEGEREAWSRPSARARTQKRRIIGISEVHLHKSGEELAAGQHAETDLEKAHLRKSSSPAEVVSMAATHGNPLSERFSIPTTTKQQQHPQSNPCKTHFLLEKMLPSKPHTDAQTLLTGVFAAVLFIKLTMASSRVYLESVARVAV